MSLLSFYSERSRFEREDNKMIFVKDLTGEVFGRLTVIREDDVYISPKGRRHKQWLCECSCDKKIISVRQSHLRSGGIKSCGCLRKEVMRDTHTIDLAGRVFGRLTVIERTNDYLFPNGRPGIQYLCKCSCDGKIITILGQSLVAKNTRSCGCISDSYMSTELKKYFIKNYSAIKEYSIVINPQTHMPLRFDIYIPSNKEVFGNIYIEVNGEQHYLLNWFHLSQAKVKGTSPEEEFEYQKKKDRMKRKYARKNGIYIEIDLRKIKTVEQAIEYVEKIINSMR